MSFAVDTVGDSEWIPEVYECGFILDIDFY